MGTISFRIVEPNSKPFSDQSLLDACVDPQFSGVFPDDPDLGIFPRSKGPANVSTSLNHNQDRLGSQESRNQPDEGTRNND